MLGNPPHLALSVRTDSFIKSPGRGVRARVGKLKRTHLDKVGRLFQDCYVVASMSDGQRGAQPSNPGTYDDNIELTTGSHGSRASVGVVDLSWQEGRSARQLS